MRGMVATGVLAGLLIVVTLVPNGLSDHQVQERDYIGGTAHGGGAGPGICQGLAYDIGAACGFTCPHNPCLTLVDDDHYGTDAWYRICVDGETFCRPGQFRGESSHSVTPGTGIIVVPAYDTATMGTAYVW